MFRCEQEPYGRGATAADQPSAAPTIARKILSRPQPAGLSRVGFHDAGGALAVAQQAQPCARWGRRGMQDAGADVPIRRLHDDVLALAGALRDSAGQSSKDRDAQCNRGQGTGDDDTGKRRGGAGRRRRSRDRAWAGTGAKGKDRQSQGSDQTAYRAAVAPGMAGVNQTAPAPLHRPIHRKDDASHSPVRQ